MDYFQDDDLEQNEEYFFESMESTQKSQNEESKLYNLSNFFESDQDMQRYDD